MLPCRIICLSFSGSNPVENFRNRRTESSFADIFKRCGKRRKNDSVCVKQLMFHLTLSAVLLVKLSVAVFVIAKQRVPDVCKMRPYLMGFSGNQFHFQQRFVPLPTVGLIF